MPGSLLKICAMPTASDTAPPVRPATCSPTSASMRGERDGVLAERAHTTAGGVLIAK